VVAGPFDFGRRFRFFLEPLAPFVGRHELLHPRVAAVDGEDAAFRIDRNPVGKIELAVPVPVAAPLRDEIPFLIEFLDAMVAGVRYIHVACTVDGNPPR
jgi:hypothetical protein